jgi:hypothetical protein
VPIKETDPKRGDPEIERKLLSLINDLDQFSQQKYFAAGLNIFETAGLYRQEIRHSNVLAFFLRPVENHGLGDSFLRNLIYRALEDFSGEPPSVHLILLLPTFRMLWFRENGTI